MNFFRNFRRNNQKYCTLLVFLVLGGQHVVQGQSGRRNSKPQPERTSLPNPVASPSPEEANSKMPTSVGGLKNAVRLSIARESTQRHLQSEDVIFASFVNRLNSFVNVAATPIGELKRQEAVIQAKGSSDSFVVLLKFDIDSFQNGTIILNSPDLQVEYQILAPKTGKKLSHGKVYFQSIGGGRMRKSEWPGGTPIKITAEATGIEVAEHVHDWLRLDETRALKPE
ncbi:MAG TPA: hypothetical protein VJU86_19835 [Pyrinomonadaceae bacterium]|nr:hypothetical protein [Pyrinomonadaceae bacterium]